MMEVQSTRLMILYMGLEDETRGLILKIKDKEDQCELRVAPNWITLLQIDEDALKST